MATSIITRSQSRVLFTGVAGQVGGLLLSQAQERYGDSNVLATDLKEPLESWKSTTLFEKLDVTDSQKTNINYLNNLLHRRVIFKKNFIYSESKRIHRIKTNQP